MVEPRIRELISAHQRRLIVSLQEARAKFAHAGDIGSAGLEAPFRDFLRGHLPHRLSVGEGEVIDSSGRSSRQTDVLILDEDHPFRLEADRPGLALIEGVAAAGELKSNLTSGDLDRALTASATFKQLRADEVEGTMMRASPGDITRFYDHRPYFVLAAESQLTLATVAERVRELDLETNGQIADAVYLLDRGWVANFGDGKGTFQFRTDAGQSVQAWVEREIPPGQVLFDFFVWLSAVMPRHVRFATPFQKYL